MPSIPLGERIAKATKSHTFKLDTKYILKRNLEENKDEDDDEVVLPQTEPYTMTPEDQPESASATAANSQVPASKPVSTKGFRKGNKLANIQIMKFANFRALTNRIMFSTFFYFINRIIPRYIIFRLRITYNSRLRNLQEETAESVRVDCALSDESLAGIDGISGRLINFQCESQAARNPNNANIQLNTDVNLVFVNSDGTTETIAFDNVNFVGKSSEEAKNIQNNTELLNGINTLKDSVISFEKYILKFTGILQQLISRRLALSDGAAIKMNLESFDGVTKSYNCILKYVSSTTELSCDASNLPITSTVQNMHLSTGMSSDGTFLIVEMKNPSDSTMFTLGNSNNVTYVEPPVAEEYTPTDDDQPENGNATAKDAQVPADKPVSRKGRQKGNKKASIQIMKFHGFKAPKGPGRITFGMFFYFINRMIPHYIIFRLRITYNSRLRNLQTALADSARSDCTITDGSLDGKILNSEEGANVNYDCGAYATQDASNASIELNTDFDLTLVDKDGNTESIGFEDVNFDEDTAEESQNIQANIQDYSGGFSTLQKAVPSIEGFILKIIGTLSTSGSRRRLAIEDGTEITMNLNTTKNGQDVKIPYLCVLNSVEDFKHELNCNTTDNPINTNAQKLHLSSGNSSDALLFVEMENPDDTTAIKSTGQEDAPITYPKSSGGLSGGAIAGIVIACVAVLAAVVVTVFMIKKSSTPVDNSGTVADLKTDNL